jgi:hypothetical protein
MGSWIKTITLLVVAGVLSHLLPTAIFRTIDTLNHEFGHALMTIIFSGDVTSIELLADNSGVTYFEIDRSWTIVPISLAGYITASLVACMLFVWYAKDKMRLGIQLMTVVAIITLILFIDNNYGYTWLISFILINVAMLAFSPKWLFSWYYLFVSFICLVESVLGPITLVMIAWDTPLDAGDASNLSEYTLIPSMVWAIGFVLFSLWCAKKSVAAMMDKKQQSS